MSVTLSARRLAGVVCRGPAARGTSSGFGRPSPRVARQQPLSARAAIDIGGMTPEAKAGKALAKLFTFVAARTIMTEIEDYDNEGGLRHDPVWNGLQDALASGMGEHFVEDMMNHPDHEMRMTAMRIIEVRAEYMAEAFNWDTMRASALKACQEEKEQITMSYLTKILPTDAAASGESREGSESEGTN